MEWFSYLEQQTDLLITNLGISTEWAVYCRVLLFTVFLVILSSFAFFVTKRIVIHYLYKIFRKTSFTWDDLLIEKKVFDNLAHIVPALFVNIDPRYFQGF